MADQLEDLADFVEVIEVIAENDIQLDADDLLLLTEDWTTRIPKILLQLCIPEQYYIPVQKWKHVENKNYLMKNIFITFR